MAHIAEKGKKRTPYGYETTQIGTIYWSDTVSAKLIHFFIQRIHGVGVKAMNEFVHVKTTDEMLQNFV